MNEIHELSLLGYIAGVLDGESWIGIVKDSRRSDSFAVQVVVTQAGDQGFALLAWLQFRTGVGTVRKKVDATERWKTQYVWYIGAHQAVELLSAVYDFLVMKKDQARIVLDFYNTADKQQLYESIKYLNSRGP